MQLHSHSVLSLKFTVCKNENTLYKLFNSKFKKSIQSWTPFEHILFFCPRWETCEHRRVWKWKFNLHLQSCLWWMDPDEKHFLHWQVKPGADSSKVGICSKLFAQFLTVILTWNQSSSMSRPYLMHNFFATQNCAKVRWNIFLFIYVIVYSSSE